MIKMIAMGFWGRGTYLADSWNRLDFFIVMSGALEFVDNLNLTAIRAIRVLRPLRAINRIPSEFYILLRLLDDKTTYFEDYICIINLPTKPSHPHHR